MQSATRIRVLDCEVASELPRFIVMVWLLAQVRRQMKMRLKNHEERNAARKKTDEEKRDKKLSKLGETFL